MDNRNTCNITLIMREISEAEVKKRCRELQQLVGSSTKVKVINIIFIIILVVYYKNTISVYVTYISTCYYNLKCTPLPPGPTTVDLSHLMHQSMCSPTPVGRPRGF